MSLLPPSLALLRHRPVLAIWMAQLLSVTGDRFFGLAIMWLALQRSGPATMGLVAIAESVPYIVIGAFGHRLLARCASFRALAGIDAIRAGLTVFLPIAWASGGTPAMLAVVAALGVLGAVFDPSLSALIPELVDAPRRSALIALMDLTVRLARIGGPALAGILLAFTPPAVLFVADAATFAVSALALVALARAALTTHVHAEPSAEPVATAAEERPRARRLLREHPELSTAFGVQGVGMFFNALPGIGLPVLLAHQLGAGPVAYGWVMTATGVAALAGNLMISRAPAGGFLTRFCLAWAVVGILQIATGAAGSLAWVVVFATMTGFVNPVIGITMGTRLAQFTPAARLRLLSINHLVMRGAGTAGMAFIPALIASSPARGFMAGGAILASAAGLGALVTPTASRRVRMRAVETAGTTTVSTIPPTCLS